MTFPGAALADWRARTNAIRSGRASRAPGGPPRVRRDRPATGP